MNHAYQLENNPRLLEVRAALEKNPKLPKYHFVSKWGIGKYMLDFWEEHKWIMFSKQTKKGCKC